MKDARRCPSLKAPRLADRDGQSSEHDLVLAFKKAYREKVLGADSSPACLFGSQSPARLRHEGPQIRRKANMVFRGAPRYPFEFALNAIRSIGLLPTDLIQTSVTSRDRLVLRTRVGRPSPRGGAHDKHVRTNRHRLTLAPEMSQSHGAIATAAAPTRCTVFGHRRAKMIILHSLYVPYRP
jgi:hypothetical protein